MTVYYVHFAWEEDNMVDTLFLGYDDVIEKYRFISLKTNKIFVSTFNTVESAEDWLHNFSLVLKNDEYELSKI